MDQLFRSLLLPRMVHYSVVSPAFAAQSDGKTAHQDGEPPDFGLDIGARMVLSVVIFT